MGIIVVSIFLLLTLTNSWSVGAADLLHTKGGAEHPCYRACDGIPQTCTYNFTVREVVTMSSKCGRCPYVRENCFNAGCITAGGYVRPVSVINNELPGTSIQVCLGDTVVVNMMNSLPIEGITIHWHGIHQNERPYMDGTPYVTQCPVSPHDTFQYKWKADTPGTHMWHSHVGFEESDGMFGSLIVRRPQDEEPNSKLYDYDLPEHVIVVWHLFSKPTKEVLTKALFVNQQVSGEGLIVNGKGHIVNFTANGTTHSTPLEIFNVTKGNRYLFRVIFNSALPCPVQMSVEKHSLLVVASDGASVAPFEVDSIMVNGGERYDIVLNADQEVGNYWIRFRGAGTCFASQVHQEAVLHYNDATDVLPNGTPTYQEAAVPGKLLNPSESTVSTANYTNNELIYLSELTSNEQGRLDISGVPDYVFYYDLTELVYADAEFAARYPQVNNVTFAYPSFPLFTQREEITPGAYCTNEDLPKICKQGQFCQCPYVFEAKNGSLVEVVFVDSGRTSLYSHPMHLHGYNFEVVAMGASNDYVSLEEIQEANEKGLIEKKFTGAPVKDTVSVPNRGYAIIRFWANNPGYWIFHCHISNHAELGMATVLKVGDHSEMVPVPRNFPQCGDWKLDS
ncbi:uncharacterized protein [Anabrus simplex]|uniref:uncharacterized protein n=1 Tax=Anabrus simplex TaxID=316456 RepID=UPI0034DCEA5E